MDHNITIYVVIPVYNCVRYLQQAVESILSQPYGNIRICIVDDGSKDGSGELCDTLAAAETRIHVIHQPNAGVSEARNAGIDYVISVADIRKDYIVFCDADDLWVPNAITEDFFKNRDDYDMYVFNMLGSNQEMDRFRILTSYQDEDITDTPAIIWEWASFFVCHLYSCALISKYNIRFSTLTKYVEDRMFDSVCLYLSDKVHRCSRYLYIYRYNSSSAMHTKNRFSKIDYFSQIINGWIETDQIINSWKEETGKTSRMGYTLASIYFMDMAAEHYQRWGSRKKIEAVLRSHPYYYLFENMVEKDVSPAQYRNHLLMKSRPAAFCIRNYIAGIRVFILELLFRIPLVKKMHLNKKYHLTVMPVNEE
jgi:glycosyltransferase involved in cell wall biosynthesis